MTQSHQNRPYGPYGNLTWNSHGISWNLRRICWEGIPHCASVLLLWAGGAPHLLSQFWPASPALVQICHHETHAVIIIIIIDLCWSLDIVCVPNPEASSLQAQRPGEAPRTPNLWANIRKIRHLRFSTHDLPEMLVLRKLTVHEQFGCTSSTSSSCSGSWQFWLCKCEKGVDTDTHGESSICVDICNIYIYNIPVVPGQAGGGSFKEKKL